jgi:hypothetical protein
VPVHVRMARKLRHHLSGSFALPGAARRFAFAPDLFEDRRFYVSA